ncbi:MAG: hypothetical protein J6U43_06580 [Bacteroidales bacterium]|nr:hypothetical protein [Bacteroidales bacterium]
MVTELLQGLVQVPMSLLAQTQQERYLNEYNKLSKEYYNKEMQRANNLFNRSYYRNYLDTAPAQRMLKQLREQLGEQTRAMRNTANVMGLTGESLGAIQKSNNKAIDQAFGALASADAQQKENALLNYESVRSKLDNFLFNTRLEDLNKRMQLSNKQGAFMPLLNGMMGYIGTLADQQSGMYSLTEKQNGNARV